MFDKNKYTRYIHNTHIIERARMQFIKQSYWYVDE